MAPWAGVKQTNESQTETSYDSSRHDLRRLLPVQSEHGMRLSEMRINIVFQNGSQFGSISL